VFRRIVALIAPHRYRALLVVVFTTLAAVAGTLPPLFVRNIIDVAAPGHDARLIVLDAVGMFLTGSLVGVFGVCEEIYNVTASAAIVRDLRTELALHLQRLPLSFFTSTRGGELMNRVSQDVDSLNTTFGTTLISITGNVAILASAVVASFLIDVRLALLTIALVPLMLIPVPRVGRRMYAQRKGLRGTRDLLTAILQESLSVGGVTLAKTYGRRVHEEARLAEAGDAVMQAETKLALTGRWFSALLAAMAAAGPALIWIVGAIWASRGGVSLGTVVALAAYHGRIYGPASALLNVQVQIVSVRAVFERIFAYLDTRVEPQGGERLAPDRLGEGIAFEAVDFAYERELVLRQVTFSALAGQLTAVVGPSGSGKSTIASLLARLHDPQGGRITLDGTDLREFSLESLRARIALVSQDAYLLHDTVTNNLRYARPEATQTEIVAAARHANIHDFVMSLPEGYDTVVGERGYKLSGGERQRLSLARAFLKDAPIVVLDEATSALDSENEEAVRIATSSALAGKTVVVISHRPSAIIDADVIHVFDKGRMVESGRRNELVEADGLFAALFGERIANERRPAPRLVGSA
jgi:ATP-binding cassette subfamily B protein